MRHMIICFLLTGGLLLSGCSNDTSSGRAFTKAQLAKAIASSLKTNRFSDYEKRFSNKADVAYHFHNVIAYRSKRTKDQAARAKLHQHYATLLEKFPDRRKQRLVALRKEFKAIRAKLENYKVDWNNLHYTGFHVERARNMYQMPTADLLINLTDNKHAFVIRIPLCIKVKRGWIFTEGMRWEGGAPVRHKVKVSRKTANIADPH